jgi:hypothetical protein
MMATSERRWSGGLLLLAGALSAFLVLGVVRYALMPQPEPVHFHANWALFVDGQRMDLSGREFMEDVAQCSVDPTHQRAEDRVHMHENNHDVVHVHASGVTWGLLLANIGMWAGNNYLDVGSQLLQNGEAGQLKFILNGTQVFSIRSLPIRSQDRLLISYGPETADEAIATQFPTVASTAGEYNTRPDPATCSGGLEETSASRLRRAFLF